MQKIWLIIQREFLNRVFKKSFLIATILIPLIFPCLMGVLIYTAMEQKKHADKPVIYYIDESQHFVYDTSRYVFNEFHGSVTEAKEAFEHGSGFGFLHIPPIDPFNPQGIILYTKVNPSANDIGHLEWMFENQLKDIKMRRFNIRKSLLDSLKSDITIQSIQLSEGTEKTSDARVSSAIGTVSSILMYFFIFVYGAQIMQGVIEEKSSKVVEIIVSSVKPFQLMMGKIIGLASVGLLQFMIWIVLMSVLSALVLASFGLNLPQQEVMEQLSQNSTNAEALQIIQVMDHIPFTRIVLAFLFYFLGGFLLYGALFAAVGSAVDSPAEAQQFVFPLTIPMLIAYFGLFIFVLDDPQSTASVWLSLIPFTSPIAMMGRIAFGVPDWQLLLSILLLIAGFLCTTWFAGRIYRVGILTHGSKVSYKVLAKWFLMKG